MKFKVTYRLKVLTGERYLLEEFDRTAIVEAEQPDDQLIEVALSKEINKPLNEIKILLMDNA